MAARTDEEHRAPPTPASGVDGSAPGIRPRAAASSMVEAAGRVDPSTVVEMLADEALADHFVTLCNIISDHGATTQDIDKAMHHAMVQCFAVINEHARVTSREVLADEGQPRGDNDVESVAAITDLGVRLGEMRAMPPPPSAPDIKEMTEISETWHSEKLITDFERNSIQRLIIEANSSICSYVHSVLHPAPAAKTPSTAKSMRSKRLSFMGLGGRVDESHSNNNNADSSNTQMSNGKVVASSISASAIRPILKSELKMELAQMLLRAWDAGHVGDDLLRGRGAANSIDIGSTNGLHATSGQSLVGGHSAHSSNSGVHNNEGGGTIVGERPREVNSRSGMSQRLPSIRETGKLIERYSLMPPDGTNILTCSVDAGHVWEVRIKVGEEQEIHWEYRAYPPDQCEFSLRFNGELMLPEAMLASQAPNVGSIMRKESGTYYFLFRNVNSSGRMSRASDRQVHLWCSMRCPGEGDMIERRHFVRSGRYICMQDSFPDPTNLNTMTPLQISGIRLKSSDKVPTAVLSSIPHLGLRLWKQNLGDDCIIGTTPLYIELEGRFLTIIDKTRLVFTPQCDKATLFYLRWLHPHEQLRVGSICELSTSWNAESYILCRTQIPSGRALVGIDSSNLSASGSGATSGSVHGQDSISATVKQAMSSDNTTTNSSAAGTVPHWSLVLVAESLISDDNDCPFGGNVRKVSFTPSLPGIDSKREDGVKSGKTIISNSSSNAQKPLTDASLKASVKSEGGGILGQRHGGIHVNGSSGLLMGYDYDMLYYNHLAAVEMSTEAQQRQSKRHALAAIALRAHTGVNKARAVTELETPKDAWMEVAFCLGIVNKKNITNSSISISNLDVANSMNKFSPANNHRAAKSRRPRYKGMIGSPNADSACSACFHSAASDALMMPPLSKDKCANMVITYILFGREHASPDTKRPSLVQIEGMSPLHLLAVELPKRNISPASPYSSKCIGDLDSMTSNFEAKKSRLDHVLLGWTLLQDRVGIDISGIMAAVLGTCILSVHNAITGSIGGNLSARHVIDYCLLMLSSPVYEAKLLRHPNLLATLRNAEADSLFLHQMEQMQHPAVKKLKTKDESSILKSKIDNQEHEDAHDMTKARKSGSLRTMSSRDFIRRASEGANSPLSMEVDVAGSSHELRRGSSFHASENEPSSPLSPPAYSPNILELNSINSTKVRPGMDVPSGTPFGTGVLVSWRFASSGKKDTVIAQLKVKGWRLASGEFARIFVTKQSKDLGLLVMSEGTKSGIPELSLGCDENIREPELDSESKLQGKVPVTLNKLVSDDPKSDKATNITATTDKNLSTSSSCDQKQNSATLPHKNRKPRRSVGIYEPRNYGSDKNWPWPRLRDYAYVVDKLAIHFFERDLAFMSAIAPCDLISGATPTLVTTLQHAQIDPQLPNMERSKSSRILLPSPLAALLRENQQRMCWLQSEILQERDVARRARTLEIVIDLALSSRRHRNFQMLLCCFDVLRSAPILRLVDTWSRVRAKRHAEFERLKIVCAPYMNFHNLRRIIRSCTADQPYIPCIRPLLCALRHAARLPTVKTESDICWVNFAQLCVVQDILRQYESPILGILGSTLQSTCSPMLNVSLKDQAPNGDETQLDLLLKSCFPAALSGKVSLGDFSVYTFDSPKILLAQSLLVEPSIDSSTSLQPLENGYIDRERNPSTSRIYHSVGNLVLAGSKHLPVERFSAAPPLSFANARRYAGVAHLDENEGSTLRELGVEEIMDMLLTEDGVVVGSGSPGIMGVADYFEPKQKLKEPLSKEESVSTRSASNSINSFASDSMRGYQSKSAVISNASAVAVGGISEDGEVFLPNPHRQYIDRFAAQFRAVANHTNHMMHVKGSSGVLKKTNQSETLLRLTISAVSTLSEHVTADLVLAAPWIIPNVDDLFEEDLDAVDNDGGRRTSFGVFHSTSDAVKTAAIRNSKEHASRQVWQRNLHRITNQRSQKNNDDSDSARRQRRKQKLTCDMKLQIKRAVTHALLGRVGLRLWAAVRRDYIAMDKHLERCRLAMSSLSDAMLWNLCSDANSSANDPENPPSWPYITNCWHKAISNMDAVSYPRSPDRKMKVLAAVFTSIDEEVNERGLPSLTADTLLPILLFVVCRSELRFKHATIHFLQSFIEADRNLDKNAGRDLFCLANVDMVLRIAARFPNFY